MIGKLGAQSATASHGRTASLPPARRKAIASNAGQARATALTPEQRRAIASKAARTRWGRD